MTLFLKHKKHVDVCLEVVGPIRFYEEKAIFKARFWNLGQGDSAFPIQVAAHRETIEGGLDEYLLVNVNSPFKLRKAFEDAAQELKPRNKR